MNQASLSRWTMSYFACALVALLAAEALMALGYGFPQVDLREPATLLLVHLVALGWLSLLLTGALFQFVPVLVSAPLYSNDLPLPALVLLLLGLGGLLGGFLQLETGNAELPLLPLGAVLLGAGFVVALYTLGRTMWAARPLPLAARFVAVGLVSLVATALLGNVFSFVLSGVSDLPVLVALTGTGLPLHAIAGIGGWLTFTAIGVSYRLFAMFMLAPEDRTRTATAALWFGAGALVAGIGGGTIAILYWGDATLPLLVAAALALPSVGLYGYDVVQLFRRRKRRKLEANSSFARLALLSLGAAAVLLATLILAGELEAHVGALVFLLAFGWLTGLGLAKLYKIVAFLTWLECYGPVLGKAPTPRVQDLVVETRAAKWFMLYYLGSWGATLALLARQPLVFRGAAAVMLVGTIGLVVQLVRARRLADVGAELRLPEGVRRPRLLTVTPAPQ